MSTVADQIGHEMHDAIGGMAQAAMAAWIISRQDAGRRDAEAAAAAQGARALVLRGTVHGLRRDLADQRAERREQILDAQADAAWYRAENARLHDRVAQLEAALVNMDGDCRTLATALREARAAA